MRVEQSLIGRIQIERLATVAQAITSCQYTARIHREHYNGEYPRQTESIRPAIDIFVHSRVKPVETSWEEGVVLRERPVDGVIQQVVVRIDFGVIDDRFDYQLGKRGSASGGVQSGLWCASGLRTNDLIVLLSAMILHDDALKLTIRWSHYVKNQYAVVIVCAL